MTDLSSLSSAGEPDDDEVVCVAAVPVGQVVDWSPDGYIPEPAAWAPGRVFDAIQATARQLQIPVIGDLYFYGQHRLSADQSALLLERWSDLEIATAGTTAAPWVAEIRAYLEQCASSNARLELLIEGP